MRIAVLIAFALAWLVLEHWARRDAALSAPSAQQWRIERARIAH